MLYEMLTGIVSRYPLFFFVEGVWTLISVLFQDPVLGKQSFGYVLSSSAG